MRIMTFSMMSAVLALGAAGAAAAMSPASGTIVPRATAPSVEGVSGTINYRATATFSDGSSADRLYSVRLDADSDGDGIGDEKWLRVRCDNGAVAAAFEYDVKAPRDVATGQASGRRQHGTVTITKEWGPPPPMLKTGAGGAAGGGVVGKTLGWNLGTMKGSRVDHSGASDASAGKGAKDGAKPSVVSYDVKKVEGIGARVDPSRASNDTAGIGADRKTMAHDSWTAVTMKEGSPNLCD